MYCSSCRSRRIVGIFLRNRTTDAPTALRILYLYSRRPAPTSRLAAINTDHTHHHTAPHHNTQQQHGLLPLSRDVRFLQQSPVSQAANITSVRADNNSKVRSCLFVILLITYHDEAVYTSKLMVPALKQYQ